MSKYQKILCIDFDGVIHKYEKWAGIDKTPGLPVDHAAEWLQGLIDDPDFRPMIYSSRSKNPKSLEVMKEYIRGMGVDPDDLEFPTEKPPAFVTIDDRAICFTGVFPTNQEIKDFKPWNKR